jgi:gag-polypeptide of LTR copia-type
MEPQPIDSALLIENLNNTLSKLLLQQKPTIQNQDGFTSAMSIKLDGKNFYLWSQMLKMKFAGRDKMGCIDGLTPQPPPDDDSYKRWVINDSLVRDYMINSMDPSLIGNFLPYSTAKEMWDAVCTTFFDGSDLSQVLDLKRRINRVKQHGGTIENYYTQLQGFWKELDIRRPNPMGCSSDIDRYKKVIQDDRVLIFLDGLDDRLDQVRANVLQVQPFPTVDEVFAIVRKEEVRQTVMMNKGDLSESSMAMIAKDQNFNKNNKNLNYIRKPNNPGGCSYCKNPKHTKDQCFKLIGYPEWWKDPRKNKQGAAHEVTASTGDQAKHNMKGVVPVHGPGPFMTREPASNLCTTSPNGAEKLSLLPTVEDKEGKCYALKEYDTNDAWIIDSGATDHMTYSKTDLISKSEPRQTEIVNANGEVYPVTGAGDVKVSSTINLSNTLLVPSRSTKLLSVGQICEELNCAVLMYLRFCIFQDLLTKEIIGRGTRRGRLYHLDNIVGGRAHLTTSSGMDRKSLVWLWHQRLGHTSFGI